MLSWLFPPPRFRVYEDSFARTRAAMFLGLRAAIEERLKLGQSILLVTHFARSFEELQDHLDQWSMEYQIGPTKIAPFQLPELLGSGEQMVLLSLSNQLVPEDVSAEANPSDKTTCVVVIERHPNGTSDQRLESFCREIPGFVEFGYFMSFEDGLISTMINESALRIIDMFGLGENEMITSNMISRRLRALLAKNSKQIVTDHPADSFEEWVKLNPPLDKDRNKER